MLLTSLTVAFLCLLNLSLSQWQFGSGSLPRSVHAHCAGIYGDSIFILGSYDYNRNLIEYVISENKFIDHGENWNSYNVYGWAQFWTQVNHLIYLKDYSTNALHIFNMQTKTFTYNFISNLPTNGYNRACVASSATHLFVVGGVANNDYYDPIATVDAYNLANKQWLNNVPSMQRNRGDLSCIVHKGVNKLYAIAGHSIVKSSYHSEDTIEVIDINDITSKSWKYTSKNLATTLAWVRSVVHQNTIYAIGGARGDPSHQSQYYVHTINVLTDEVSSSSDQLPQDTTALAAVVVNDRIYAFGGWTDGTGAAVSTWMTYDAPSTPTQSTTEDPTNKPTNRPTNRPTDEPTYIPTNKPTLNPTKRPTNEPTFNPTLNPTPKHTPGPTKKPTLAPTKRPTIDPTQRPTPQPNNEPTLGPTKKPTSHPTKKPIIQPTFIPTLSPTRRPIINPQTSIHVAVPATNPTTRLITNTAINFLTSTTKKLNKVKQLPPKWQTDNSFTAQMIMISCLAMFVCCCIWICIYYLRIKARSFRKHTDMIELSNKHQPQVHKGVSYTHSQVHKGEPRAGTRRDEREDVRDWIRYKVRLPQYEQAFICNGYDNIRCIAVIKHADELKMIGITLVGHQQLILAEIEKLKGVNEDTAFGGIEIKPLYKQTDGSDSDDSMGIFGKTRADPSTDVRDWIKYEVGLPQYEALFINNGYENMRCIAAIKDSKELKMIGIKSKQHRLLLLAEIMKLQMQSMNDNAVYGEINMEESSSDSDIIKINPKTRGMPAPPTYSEHDASFAYGGGGLPRLQPPSLQPSGLAEGQRYKVSDEIFYEGDKRDADSYNAKQYKNSMYITPPEPHHGRNKKKKYASETPQYPSQNASNNNNMYRNKQHPPYDNISHASNNNNMHMNNSGNNMNRNQRQPQNVSHGYTQPGAQNVPRAWVTFDKPEKECFYKDKKRCKVNIAILFRMTDPIGKIVLKSLPFKRVGDLAACSLEDLDRYLAGVRVKLNDLGLANVDVYQEMNKIKMLMSRF